MLNNGLNEIVYSVDFHNDIGLKTKPAGDIFQIVFIYIFIKSF